MINKKVKLENILVEAQWKLVEAIELLNCYVEATGDQNTRNELVVPLEIMATRDHPYGDGFINIDTLIDKLKEKE